MVDYEGLKNILNSHSRAYKVLSLANGKRHYKEIARLAGVHETAASGILRRAYNLGLLEKNGKLYGKAKEFRSIDLKKIIKDGGIVTTADKPIRTKKKQKKSLTTQAIKKEITEYLTNHFLVIEHPFNSSVKLQLSKAKLQDVSNTLFRYLDADSELDQLKGLSLRFYESFAVYMGSSRLRKAEQINAFGVLVKNFEPFVKKVAVLKSHDTSLGRRSLNRETISHAMNFTSDIDKYQDEYWSGRPISEACVRTIYPFRHKEAHEARDYYPFQMERTAFYMFAAIIFICLE